MKKSELANDVLEAKEQYIELLTRMRTALDEVMTDDQKAELEGRADACREELRQYRKRLLDTLIGEYDAH